ncbi:AtpZ/AtpI family protein [Patescibacteria group bacterium]|nr:AtpZ/AtpI family protein [Patescibacteria group bacterium]MBU0879480.1 AtpZ/AtpI family protein [Patescibacteria group bacterium]MBU0880126.1 AtpZ/AtpI family protein [Patescibacteria group bacterium]MBU0897548.1 AtpZ/AtpI family protein [Patescibacteria group bacterium]MBU1062736.1 AtpZ/AtpI family protein [Patescibacteria group bacterium]
MKKQAWWLPAMLMFTRLSVWIIGPVIVGLFVGKWLDNKYQSKPWLFLLSIGIAFIISMFGLIKSTLDEYKKIEIIEKNKKLKKE